MRGRRARGWVLQPPPRVRTGNGRHGTATRRHRQVVLFRLPGPLVGVTLLIPNGIPARFFSCHRGSRLTARKRALSRSPRSGGEVRIERLFIIPREYDRARNCPGFYFLHPPRRARGATRSGVSPSWRLSRLERKLPRTVVITRITYARIDFVRSRFSANLPPRQAERERGYLPRELLWHGPIQCVRAHARISARRISRRTMRETMANYGRSKFIDCPAAFAHERSLSPLINSRVSADSSRVRIQF